MPSQTYFGQPTILAAGGTARTTSSQTANLKDTANQIPASDAVAFILNVTALSGAGAAVNLDVWIDTSWDGATTWMTAYKFTRVTTSTATLRIDTRTNGKGLGEVGSQESVITYTTGALNTNTVLAADQRVRWEIGGASSLGSATFGVFALSIPPGARGL